MISGLVRKYRNGKDFVIQQSYAAVLLVSSQIPLTAPCGGIPGFYEMLDAIADPGHPNHAEAKQWADEYDPETIDELPNKYALSRIANRRNAAKARLARKGQTDNDN